VTPSANTLVAQYIKDSSVHMIDALYVSVLPEEVRLATPIAWRQLVQILWHPSCGAEMSSGTQERLS